MARQWRIEFPGAVYHVMSRGNNREDIFRSDADRHLFLELLAALAERYNIQLHAYVLMGNHYHLLLKTNEANLSKAMQWFGTSYTRKFNLTHNKNGHLFQGRFKSIIVENDAYLLRLSCYIHRNPLRARLVDRLVDYPWSSYRFYAYDKNPPVWLTTRSILGQVSGRESHKAYRKKVQHYSDEQGRVWEDVKHGFIFGSWNFAADLRSRFLGDRKDVELPQHNSLFSVFNPETLVMAASRALGFDLESVRTAKRVRPEEKEKRDVLVYLLWKTGQLSNKAIGSFVGVSYSAISKITSRFDAEMLTDKGLREKLNEFNSQLKV